MIKKKVLVHHRDLQTNQTDQNHDLSLDHVPDRNPNPDQDLNQDHVLKLNPDPDLKHHHDHVQDRDQFLGQNLDQDPNPFQDHVQEVNRNLDQGHGPGPSRDHVDQPRRILDLVLDQKHRLVMDQIAIKYLMYLFNVRMHLLLYDEKGS